MFVCVFFRSKDRTTQLGTGSRLNCDSLTGLRQTKEQKDKQRLEQEKVTLPCASPREKMTGHHKEKGGDSLEKQAGQFSIFMLFWRQFSANMDAFALKRLVALVQRFPGIMRFSNW